MKSVGRFTGHGAWIFLVLIVCFSGQAQTFSSSNLPIIVINTNGQDIPNEPKIQAEMGIVYNGAGVRNNLSGPYNNYNGKIGIEIRGSSSQSFPKKQYGIELQDALGNGISAPLLGMPAEEDWVLFAPYNDKSLMRDVLAYKLGRDLGRYAPRTRFCELVLNGSYEGIYVLIEKIKRDNDRVDVARLDPNEISGDDVTGGYIIKIDKESGSDNDGWYSNFNPPNRSGGQRIYYQYDYPKASEISQPQKTYIKNYLAQFEAVLNSSTYNDPFNGYAKYIDADSFIDYFIMNEVSKNVDGYRLSTYLHKDKDSNGGKLKMGPIWDYNLAFGNADYCTRGNPEGWVTNFNNLCSQDFWLIPFWWDRLNQDPVYANKLAIRWASLRQDILSTQRIHTYIDSVANVLNKESQQRNFQRWPVLNRYVWPNYFVGPTYDSEVSWLKNWVSDRMKWLDTFMPKAITAIDNRDSFMVNLFPNPFKKELQVQIIGAENQDISLVMFDMQGRETGIDFSWVCQGNEIDRVINTEGIAPGMYFYQVRNSNHEVVTGKVIKIE